jgi:hypothetical protein
MIWPGWVPVAVYTDFHFGNGGSTLFSRFHGWPSISFETAVSRLQGNG